MVSFEEIIEEVRALRFLEDKEYCLMLGEVYKAGLYNDNASAKKATTSLIQHDQKLLVLRDLFKWYLSMMAKSPDRAEAVTAEVQQLYDRMTQPDLKVV